MILSVSVFAVACGTDPVSPSVAADLPAGYRPGEYRAAADGEELFYLSVAKWAGGRAAAVSITYDAPWGTHGDHHLATDAAIARGLRMDLEMVTWIFTQPEQAPLLDTYRRYLLPRGIGFFGHGHTHASHDTMTYTEALASFSTCYHLMRTWGFRPRAYAYPGSSGRLIHTQGANRNAGFICARGSTVKRSTWHVLADDAAVAPNWQNLPSVPMGSGSRRYIRSHRKLSPILEEALKRGSWIILMYHAIGIPEGWGYYPYEDFVMDLDQIAGGDYWSANLGQAAAYARERSGLTVGFQPESGRDGAYLLTFRDGLPDEVYDEPLTVTFHFTGLSPARLAVAPPVGTGEPVAVRGDSARIQLLPAETPVSLTLD